MAHTQGNNSQSNTTEITNSSEGNTAQITDSSEGNSQSTNSSEGNTARSTNTTADLALYGLLYQAAEKDDWKKVEEIIERNSYSDVITAKINGFGRTILHLVVCKEKSKRLLESIPSKINESLLETEDNVCKTALSYAVIVGNNNDASSLVTRNDSLLLQRDENNLTPLHLAAEVGQKDIFESLFEKTTDKATLLSGVSGAKLCNLLVSSKLYGTTLDILKQHKDLLKNNLDLKRLLLISFARRSHEFASGNHDLMNYWQRLIYKWILVTNDNFTHHSNSTGGRDVENPNEISTNCLAKLTNSGFLQWISNGFGKVVSTSFWNTMKRVSWINHIHDKKLRDMQACELVKLICEGMSEQAEWILKKPLFIATRLGIVEFVNEIIEAFPHSTSFLNEDEDDKNLFHIAVLYRQERVIKIIKEKNHPSISKYLMTKFVDNKGNTILHLTGILHRSSQISGAALQMQRELQWFKAIENIVTQFSPNLLEYPNDDKKTPRKLFTEEHENLVEEGRKWMNNAAQSYTVVGALIITITFSAAFQIPGGTDNKVPNYLHNPAFITFVVSDAIALICSCISVLMFLAILTSRYSEEDFLKSLPKKLIVGLITLCISMGCMMVAFSAALQIALTVTKNQLILAIITSGVSLTVFAFLQFPLLIQIYRSTYLYGPDFL